MDIVSILNKQRQLLEDFAVIVDGVRPENVEPALFEKIHMQFVLTGAIDEDKAVRAVSLSVEKYCSVAKMLDKTATINYTVVLNGNLIYSSER